MCPVILSLQCVTVNDSNHQEERESLAKRLANQTVFPYVLLAHSAAI